MTEQDEPEVRITKGDPTPEEVAALVAAIAQKSETDDAAETRPTSWSAYWRTVNAAMPPPHRGPDAWRISGLPR